MRLVSVSEMIKAEQAAMNAGIPGEELMRRAGIGLADVLAKHMRLLGKHLPTAIALVGSGNNGGDALIALFALAERGWPVKIITFADRGSGDRLLQQAATLAIPALSLNDTTTILEIAAFLRPADVLIDGILGTGFKVGLKPMLAKSMGALKQALPLLPARPTIAAVDCPSGVNCDNGESAVETLPADLTVTMAACKQGLLLQPAFSLCGEIVSVDIGIEIPSTDPEPLRILEASDIAAMLPKKDWNAHKGSAGNVLVCGGSAEYVGAPALAAMGAYAVGAGLVRLAVPAFIQTLFAVWIPEVIWTLLPAGDGSLEADGAELLSQQARSAKAVLLGPGMGRQPTTQKFVQSFFTFLNGQSPRHKPIGFAAGQANAEKQDAPLTGSIPPMVVDADGLRNTAQIPEWWRQLPSGSVLTPHPGEMSALTGMTTAQINADRLSTAQKFAKQWGCTVILKGAQSVVAGPEGQAAIIPISAPALAKAGSGDVLAGMVAGLMAQGLTGYQAACCGAWLHARAGVEMAKKHGNEKTPIASGIIKSLRRVFSIVSER